MSLDEEAAISYNPDDDQPNVGGLNSILAEAERQLGQRRGVNGMGMSKTAAGEDAIEVYVQDELTLSQLPSAIRGVPVIGEITGDIRPL